MELRFTATEYQLPYGITQCYLPRDASEYTPLLTLCMETHNEIFHVEIFAFNTVGCTVAWGHVALTH